MLTKEEKLIILAKHRLGHLGEPDDPGNWFDPFKPVYKIHRGTITIQGIVIATREEKGGDMFWFWEDGTEWPSNDTISHDWQQDVLDYLAGTYSAK